MSNTSDRNNRDHPDVRIPPPLIYVAGVALGFLLEKEVPVLLLPQTASRVAALLCVAVSAILTAWSIGLFRGARTSMVPIRPTTALVVSGPYNFTRNPMYFGLVFLYLAFALWFRIFWALILLPAVIAAVQYYVISREERYLERKFGEEYLRYKARVRRWI
jgi:protein-S-isoprenylcysteine O-methyltransferase Ste14